MEVPYPAPLTAEQIAAINAGDGHARLIDPGTQVVYHVIAQAESPTISDDYVREKLAEAQLDVDRGDVAPWDVAELKRELQERRIGSTINASVSSVRVTSALYLRPTLSR